MSDEEKDQIENSTKKYFGDGPRVQYEMRAGEGSGAMVCTYTGHSILRPVSRARLSCVTGWMD
jgi:hypothetical protein